MEILFFLLMTAIGVGVAALTMHLERQKRRQIEELTRTFPVQAARPTRGLVRVIGTCASIPGRSHQIRYLVAESSPRPRPRSVQLPARLDGVPDYWLLDRTLFGQFRYVTGSGDSRTTHTRGFFYYPIPASFPSTRIKPAGIFSKFGDIDTEWAQFNRTFDTHSESPQFVSALLNPRMQEFLLRSLGGGAVTLHLIPGAMLLMLPSWKARDYPVLRRIVAEFEKRVVPFLWSDFR